ncbi:thermonuclease family protein [Solirubrobacter ginsenosidimutans]|uniref:Thermonuclease family protein n=1 Tax=Solirubrobacter ginsenosidimutans TaxID=490573 RepID=A0A9X3S7D1_9ACTN|nr:thermonuclease family protein [Solirubrobacter ginsenosidimutans]MDA0165931.1 thermonuclease family protein [Solirubrobacter ginsenosidimutans]
MTRIVGTLSRRARMWTALVIVLLIGVVAVPPAPAQDRDCGHFATQAAAQAYFVALGGPTDDPDRLDADSDGIACEALPCPCSANPGSAPAPTPTSTPTATPTPTPTPQAPAAKRSARIVRVIDGDTLRVRLSSGRQITVRLIGIDTPETKRPGVAVECGGTAASAYMHRIAFRRGRGRQVTLVNDPSQDATDRYGRTLAYVDASEKGDLSRLMLRAGWASVYVYANPFGRLARYESAAGQAAARRAGAWDRCDGDFHRPA